MDTHDLAAACPIREVTYTLHLTPEETFYPAHHPDTGWCREPRGNVIAVACDGLEHTDIRPRLFTETYPILRRLAQAGLIEHSHERGHRVQWLLTAAPQACEEFVANLRTGQAVPA
jgi:hypothetical protein